jgi:hypothetical protein
MSTSDNQKQQYQLINPIIKGSLNTVVDARNSFNAGKKMYKMLSRYFTNHVKDFYMTLQRVGTDQLSHFKINEKMNIEGGAKTVNFELVKLDNHFPDKVEKEMIKNASSLSGGRHHSSSSDSSDSSDSSSSSDEVYQPIKNFTYWALPYSQLYMPKTKIKINGLNPLDTARLFMPMFSMPINPTLEVRVDLYKYFYLNI